MGYIWEYTLTNSCGDYVEILSLGATIKSLVVPDKNGSLTDVVLGYNVPYHYLVRGGYYGATVGRNANRVKGATFTIGEKTYNLTKNGEFAQLHGGYWGFDKKQWSAKTEGETLILSCLSPDGEEGYPANLYAEVRFSFDDDCRLKIKYSAHADGDTLVNMTNHSYFNLNGAGNGDILDTYLKINAKTYTKADQTVIPTGEIESVLGTALDFTKFKKIGQDISSPSLLFGGYDHNFCLEKGYKIAAEAYSEQSGIKMVVETDCEGVQLYTSNSDLERVGKGKKVYGKYSAFCLETQAYPNAVNIPAFPSPILKKGDEYKRTTVYAFSIK